MPFPLIPLRTAYRAALGKTFYGLLTTFVLSSPLPHIHSSNIHEVSPVTLGGTEAVDPGLLQSTFKYEVTRLQPGLERGHPYKRGRTSGKSKYKPTWSTGADKKSLNLGVCYVDQWVCIEMHFYKLINLIQG